MRRIVVVVVILFVAIIIMAYSYFSRLNSERENNDSDLHAAVLNSSVVFSFQNDKSILEILKSQPVFSELIGPENYRQMVSIKKNILDVHEIVQLIEQQYIYISLVQTKNENIELLYTSQINPEFNIDQIQGALQSLGATLKKENTLTQITLSDSSVFYIGLKGNLILLSSAAEPIEDVIAAQFSKNNEFVEYIKSNSKLSKTSLAELYIDFSKLPLLLKSAISGKLSGELSVLDKQNTFGSFIYNYSDDKLLLTGSTKINDPESYCQLFTQLQAQKITITNILPENTASYSVFAINNYINWKPRLDRWFVSQGTNKTINDIIEKAQIKYHLDINQVVPKYFKNQIITFQLSTSEKLGSIALSNGDKTNQLLLELSSEYNEDIRLFSEENILYAYFGEPFRKFKRPYYTIIDNYLVFANNASTVQSFLNSYKSSRLLINDKEYFNTMNLLPNTACITFFISIQHSKELFRKNLSSSYYQHIISKNGLGNYSALIYQLSGDNGKFQTNLLLTKINEDELPSSDKTIDSLALSP